MTTTQMNVAAALLLGFIGGCMYGKSSDGDSEVSSTAVEGAGDEVAGNDRAGGGGSGAGGGGASGSGARHDSGGTATRDQRLVGDWRYTETISSGDFGIVMDQFMTFSADGTMSIRDGAAAGGGGGLDWDRPASDQAVTCEWRTSGNIIEVRGNGRDWTPMAEYELSGNTLMTTSQGQRQIWERI